jgi:thiosulfate/3-mercaptopyruvate sulfurtransferase
MRMTLPLLRALPVFLAPAIVAQQSSMVVTTDWLAQHLKDPDVVVLQIDMRGMRMGPAYAEGHVPGARTVDYMAMGATVNGINLELPPVDSLKHLFEGAGVSTNSHVVLMGPPLVVTRAWYTLHYLGLANVSALDGGITKWRAEGHPVDKSTPQVTRGTIVPSPQPQIVASTQYVSDHIGKHGVSFVDTRTPGEYDGTAARHGLASTGHVQGARLLEWESLFANDSDFTLAPMATLQALYRARVAPGDSVVTYCAIGYRASGSYFVAVLLGYPAKIYDGSYDEWSKKKMPTVKDSTPLLTP